MILCAWSYWFFAIFLVVLSPVFLLYGANKRERSRVQLEILKSIALFLLGIFPLILVIYAPLLSGESMPKPPVSTAAISPIFPDALRWGDDGNTLIKNVIPLPLIIAFFIGFYWTKRWWLWFLLAFLSFFFAMGPALEAGGMVWIFPYYYLWKTIPLINLLRWEN